MIKEITNENYDSLMNLVKEVMEAEQIPNTDTALKFFQDRLSNFKILGQEEDNVLTGALLYEEQDMKVMLLLVLPSVRNQGIGTSLLNAFTKKAEEMHIGKISANAPKQSLSFYQNYGFERISEEENVIPMEYCLGRSALGKTVTVTVDHPIGSMHTYSADDGYPMNYGYVEQGDMSDGEFQNAYVYGPEIPLETFTGIVYAIIYHAEQSQSRWVVVSPTAHVTHEEIIQAVGFDEQYYDTKFIFADENKMS